MRKEDQQNGVIHDPAMAVTKWLQYAPIRISTKLLGYESTVRSDRIFSSQWKEWWGTWVVAHKFFVGPGISAAADKTTDRQIIGVRQYVADQQGRFLVSKNYSGDKHGWYGRHYAELEIAVVD